ncbi:MAG TPA: FAD-dependent oxidoreductase [Myxococcota bacterium]|nr:FAD-dependent oxidoreductase [Myxococcota bacterium]
MGGDRIAVVGGGVAGLGAAWALSKRHEVTLFERAPALGGHACAWDHDGQRFDIGFLILHDAYYTNLRALFRRLGIEARGLPGHDFSGSYDVPGGFWTSLRDTPYRQRMRAEMLRFEEAMIDVVLRPETYGALTLAEYVAREGYSDEFVHACLVPLQSMLFVTRRDMTACSVYMVAVNFYPYPMTSFFDHVPWKTTDGTSRRYVDGLAADMAADVRLSTAVRSIERRPDGAWITTDAGRERFDQVVLATAADDALGLLADAAPEERRLLGQFTYEPTVGVIHTDPVVMPADRADWCSYNYVARGDRYPYEHVYYTYHPPQIQGWVAGDLFVTYGAPDGLIDPARVVRALRWKHLLTDNPRVLASTELHRIQGRRRTWFAGEYVSAGYGHEFSFTSGLAIARALGADYPFEDNRAARLSFYNQAHHHMRVLPDPPTDGVTSYNPTIDAGRMTRDLVRLLGRDAVLARMRDAAPGPLRGLVGRLGGPLVAYVAEHRISLVDAWRRSGGRS